MTVKELKEHLDQFHDDLIVVMSKDAEGNSHSPLSSVDAVQYEADTTWSGEVWPEGAVQGVPALLLSPVN